MSHAAWDHKPLFRRKLDHTIVQIDQKPSVENKEKFVDVGVFVPMIFPFNHCQPNDRIVYFTQSLVIPFVGAVIG